MGHNTSIRLNNLENSDEGFTGLCMGLFWCLMGVLFMLLFIKSSVYVNR